MEKQLRIISHVSYELTIDDYMLNEEINTILTREGLKPVKDIEEIKTIWLMDYADYKKLDSENQKRVDTIIIFLQQELEDRNWCGEEYREANILQYNTINP